jgi:creatinine amidohydrolase/Fe(II)-dependent formamide hydrolase-like protein
MVSLHRLLIPGSPWRLGDFQQEWWDILAPDVDDAWYQRTVNPAVDETDTSWANRRAYAQGRATRPTRASAQDTST